MKSFVEICKVPLTPPSILSKQDDALEAIVVALCKEVKLLKGELKAFRVANGGMVAHLPIPKWEVPKHKPFGSSRNVREIDNFLLRLEQYFHAMGILDDITKVQNTPLYLIDIRILW